MIRRIHNKPFSKESNLKWALEFRRLMSNRCKPMKVRKATGTRMYYPERKCGSPKCHS